MIKDKKLNRYADRSSLMKVSIKFGKEDFEFNLYEELQINESIISREIKQQPTSYAFLLLLQTNLSSSLSKAKVEEERTYNKLYIRYKKRINQSTNRPNSDDSAKALVNTNPIYIKAQHNTIALAKNLGTISNCVKAFEQRSSLLQTLSANNRKQI